MQLIDKLPYFYANNPVKSIQHGLGIEVDILNDSLKDLQNQLFVDTATWGLIYWENMLGIARNNLDYRTRRENIKAKMRSRGTTSIKVIKNIAQSYSNGEVDIIVDSNDFTFYIKFIGSKGIPAAFNELDNTIEKIKPCHLEHKYIFSYTTWDDFDSYNYNFDTWDSLNLTWDELEIYDK